MEGRGKECMAEWTSGGRVNGWREGGRRDEVKVAKCTSETGKGVEMELVKERIGNGRVDGWSRGQRRDGVMVERCQSGNGRKEGLNEREKGLLVEG